MQRYVDSSRNKTARQDALWTWAPWYSVPRPGTLDGGSSRPRFDLSSACAAAAPWTDEQRRAALRCQDRVAVPRPRQAAPPLAVHPLALSLARSVSLSLSLSLGSLSLSLWPSLPLALSSRTHKTFKEQTRPAPPGLRGGALLCAATSDRRDRGNPGNHDRGRGPSPWNPAGSRTARGRHRW